MFHNVSFCEITHLEIKGIGIKEHMFDCIDYPIYNGYKDEVTHQPGETECYKTGHFFRQFTPVMNYPFTIGWAIIQRLVAV
jgi:hypothetical protein